jgi:20S proteasome subunit beta 7|eukprot:TRINITY_DN43235_c0_g1_i1.p1 TRINITY_DN43235_c0_g1~~TRINITY_DN43235_c0_g1_i1.p1  ORF type:complete len:243 (+),score=41.21 TRINITY_DN43235_c0_g1_i1:108-836(+)
MAPGQYSADPKQHTLSPIVTGATVIGLKYNGGVMVAADTLASYGGMARYKDVCRMKKVGEYTLLGASGEFSDFQYLGDMLDELNLEDWLNEDGCSMGPKEYSSYIGRVMYNRRSKFNPLYNQFVVAGKKEDSSAMLAFIDHQGTYFEEDYIATGFGSYLAMPLLRNEWRADMSMEEAKALVIKCLQVCFYRDCQAYYKIQIGTCDGTKVTISEPEAMEHFWSHPAWLEKRLETSSRATTDTW